MGDHGRSLSPSKVDTVFPFHLVLDRDLRVLQTGASIARLHADSLIGVSFTDLFMVKTPKVACSFDRITEHGRSLFLLESLVQPGLVLRGQMLHEQGDDCVYFIGSPWVTDTNTFASLGLTLSDFAVSDAVVDYALLLQTQSVSLAESRELAGRLNESAERLVFQAFHDGLTGLPNRAFLVDHLTQVMGADRLNTAPPLHPIAVLMLDLDGFKSVNDSYGHAAGDHVLEVVGERLCAVAREGDLIARFGGDEFVLVLEAQAQSTRSTLSEQAVYRVAERVLAALSEPIALSACSAISVELSASIGIAFRSATDSPDDLLRNADLAMYSAKARGKWRYERYFPEMHARSKGRLETANDLRAAVDADQLRLVYQPILRLDGDSFAGAEALLRWQHPTRGLLDPSDFLDIAEETGLIVKIGAWVLDEACRELCAWQNAHTGPHPLRVAVNLSGRQFGPGLVRTVASTIKTHGIDPGCLTLEVTEGLIAGDGPSARSTLRHLKALGVRLAIDDFGTGHSSLGRLRDYEFAELKIDRTFVSDLDTGDPTLVATQIAMAHGLGMEAVAEGVETPAQLAYLRKAGCAQVQGYLVSPPLSPDAIRPLLAEEAEWLGDRPTDRHDDEPARNEITREDSLAPIGLLPGRRGTDW